MTWLKKIGSVVLHWLPIALGLGQFVQPSLGESAGKVVGNILGDLNVIPRFIVLAEGMIQGVSGASTGAAKLDAVAPAVQQLITEYAAANLPGAGKIKDPTKLAAAARQIASGFADALNSFEG